MREHDQDIKLLHLNVDRVVVLDKENLGLVLEGVGVLLADQLDIPKRNILPILRCMI